MNERKNDIEINISEEITKAELSLIKAIRNIEDPDQVAQVSNEVSDPNLKIGFLLIASDMIAG